MPFLLFVHMTFSVSVESLTGLLGIVWAEFPASKPALSLLLGHLLLHQRTAILNVNAHLNVISQLTGFCAVSAYNLFKHKYSFSYVISLSTAFTGFTVSVAM